MEEEADAQAKEEEEEDEGTFQIDCSSPLNVPERSKPPTLLRPGGARSPRPKPRVERTVELVPRFGAGRRALCSAPTLVRNTADPRDINNLQLCCLLDLLINIKPKSNFLMHPRHGRDRYLN